MTEQWEYSVLEAATPVGGTVGGGVAVQVARLNAVGKEGWEAFAIECNAFGPCRIWIKRRVTPAQPAKRLAEMEIAER